MVENTQHETDASQEQADEQKKLVEDRDQSSIEEMLGLDVAAEHEAVTKYSWMEELCVCEHTRGEHENQGSFPLVEKGHGHCMHRNCDCKGRGQFTWVPPIVAGAERVSK